MHAVAQELEGEEDVVTQWCDEGFGCAEIEVGKAEESAVERSEQRGCYGTDGDELFHYLDGVRESREVFGDVCYEGGAVSRDRD